MIIDLKSIPGEGIKTYEFSLDRNWWTPEKDNDQVETIDSPVNVKIEVYRVGKKYVLKGVLKGALRVTCDRCLEKYRQEVESEFNSFLIPAPEDAEKVEIELMEDDMEAVFIKDDKVNLHDLVREQLYLSLPIKCLCRNNCLGLCAKCGCNLNEGACECVKEEGHPGFAILNKLKN
ncbi:MAG: DUF177 domain-containing protein [Deltaproteobacteria bacterium]|nr:DUF177 domain-containing protein [Deltaproteobacteria bacterium]